jgi:hypothetical protein
MNAKSCGSFAAFEPSRIRTYPLRTRGNRVEVGDYVKPEEVAASAPNLSGTRWFLDGKPGGSDDAEAGLKKLAARVAECHRAGKPVMALTGAHLIKNGQHPLIIDLIRRGVLTLYGTNGAGSIHSLELALTGATSEDVRTALPAGRFGMAFETGHYLNYALRLGVEHGWGYGECMGRLYLDDEFRGAVIEAVFADYPDSDDYFKPVDGFKYVDGCLFAEAFKKGIPACVFSSIGTDIIDQHSSFDAGAKGAASGKDFLILAEEVGRATQGGVVLNIGTAVMGPEVLLKAASMAANVGCKPEGLDVAVFDIRPFCYDDGTRDEHQPCYYLRDQKSSATRIPLVFGGNGYYFEGSHSQTLLGLYHLLLRELEGA